MKTILLSLAFCAVITTAIAQNPLKNILSLNEQVNAMDSKKDIISNISAYNQSHIFSRWINACGLLQTLQNPGALTVFLPPDSAFNQSTSNKLDTAALSKKKFDIIALLTYHVLPGKVSAKKIAKEIDHGKGLAVFRTISGAPLKAQFDGAGNIVLIDELGGKSTIQQSDLKQRNGLVHLVSAVLVPKFKQI